YLLGKSISIEEEMTSSPNLDYYSAGVEQTGPTGKINGSEVVGVCPDCGYSLKYEGGCNICYSCGYSKCS
ncbi:MAG: hypothetical protein KAH57_10790, partial [Thermoplasmata archaeon]|nr:hypothetical protein [Thermoplasmata archaeon]